MKTVAYIILIKTSESQVRNKSWVIFQTTSFSGVN